MIYNNFFDSYKRILDKHKRAEHMGIRWIGTLNKEEERIELIEVFLNLGVQIRHVKNILPINFAIGGQKNKKRYMPLSKTHKVVI